MDLEDSMIQCKGCPKKFQINQIQRHIKQSSCKGQYSQEDFADLVKLCKSHTKRKRAENYKRKKSQKKVYNDSCKSTLVCHTTLFSFLG